MKKSIDTDELKPHEIEVDFVLGTIAKCLRTEPKVAETKTLQVYRQLSSEAIEDLVRAGYKVNSEVKGACHEVSWE